jgi:2-polyprenyl-6-methoxyphenol hydroxylase-like FAD-dependent oxidoreductase
LNDRLLTEAQRMNNVYVVFEHKLLRCDVSKGILTFLYRGKEKEVTADIIIGADGVYSQVRTGIMRAVKYLFPVNKANEEWISLRAISTVCGVNSRYPLRILQMNGPVSK